MSAEPSSLNLWTRQWRADRIRKARADLREHDSAYERIQGKGTDYARSIKMIRDHCAKALAVWESSPVDLEGAATQSAVVPAPAEDDARLHRFIDAAAGEGLVLDGIDAADLYAGLWPERYAAALSASREQQSAALQRVSALGQEVQPEEWVSREQQEGTK